MKLVTLLLALLISTFCQAQEVQLRWKLQPNEEVRYKTIMQELDTSKVAGFSLNLGGIFDLLNKTKGKDSMEKAMAAANALFQSLNKAIEDQALISRLTEKRAGVVDIEMTLENKSAPKRKGDSSATAMLEMMQKLSGGVMLRGAVYESGDIESFYVKNDQRNLIALFFQLPSHPVLVGDSWPIGVNFISMDQNFKCDTAYRKNQVTLVDLKTIGTDKVAVLKYDLAEFISGDFASPLTRGEKGGKTMMNMRYQAVGEFSLNQGRWLSYNGIISLASSGVMTSSSTKKFALITQ